MTAVEQRALTAVVEAMGAATAQVESEHLRAHLDREGRFLRVIAGLPAEKTTTAYRGA